MAEDEPALGQIVKESLETRDFEVILCTDGEMAWKQYLQHKPALLVLDVMMPKKDGFALARDIREQDKRTPILFLTAKSQTSDVVNGFHLGGNDYLKKPFSMEELIVRMHALLDRASQREDLETIRIGQYSFNYPKQRLTFKGDDQYLTHKETELLYHLAEQRNQVLDRSLILKKLWGDDDFFNARSMDVFITRLRKKLKQDPSVEILNVRGIGYKLIC